MDKLKINFKLRLKLINTNKDFICYSLTKDRTQIDSYILTNDLFFDTTKRLKISILISVPI